MAEWAIGLRVCFCILKIVAKHVYVLKRELVFWEKLMIEEKKGNKWWRKFLEAENRIYPTNITGHLVLAAMLSMLDRIHALCIFMGKIGN